MNYSANAKVRAELGGEAVARAKVEALKALDVAEHCNALLTTPMSDSTYEALMTGVGRRSARPIPDYLHLRGTRSAERNRARMRAISRALWRLKDRYPDDYAAIYQEERAREAAS